MGYHQDWVRVRIRKDKTEFYIEGNQIRFNGKKEIYQPVALPKAKWAQKTRFRIQRENFLWRVENLTDKMAPVQFFGERFLLVEGQNIKEKIWSYPDSLVLSVQNKELFKFDIIGIVPLEQYIAGVVASEMPIRWPIEALKAQAVVARSYALATMKERELADFHLEANILDQTFSYLNREDELRGEMKNVFRAVRETEGQVLESKDNQVLKTYYHSDCGGQTRSSAQVWGFGVNSGTAIDRSCPSNPRAQWSFSISREEINKKLRLKFIGWLGDFEELLLKKENGVGSRRVEEVEFWQKGFSSLKIRGDDFREMLGFSKIRSTNFEMEKRGNYFIFKGLGYGHGVGMCQWGTRTLALAGGSYKAILQHYYPKARLSLMTVGCEQQSPRYEKKKCKAA